MEEKKLGQESAFPISLREGESHDSPDGISKRFYAACAAMQGILSNVHTPSRSDLDSKEQLIKASYSIADELLKQENL